MSAQTPIFRPSVDVLMSTLNEEAYIGRCLTEVLEQDYEPSLVRVILVDGGSTDSTVALAHSIAREDERLTVIADGKRRNLPAALNLALETSNAELVAKIDAHGFPERDFLRRAVEIFASVDPEVACVGGRPLQEGSSPFGEAVALARTSRFGVGGSVYAGKAAREFVDTVQCGVYRRSALDDVGFFDEGMNYGEDEELNWRLVRAGYKILLDETMRFHYVTRNTWVTLFRQYRNYGRARVRVVRKHPDFLRTRHLVPAAFVASLTGLAAAAPFASSARRVLAATAAAYAAAAVASSLEATGRRRPVVTARVAACFSALHLGYGIGTMAGLADPSHSRTKRRG
jgi:succinoglycan biosynthesis protein ExoA